jgi:putative restriction endonuclease
VPTFVVDWDARGLRAAFGELAGATSTATAPDLAERRYALRLVKQRLHQASFREGVLAVRDQQPPHDHLLDAAHIDPDGRLHVSERLLMLHDGPLLEQSLKGIAGGQIRAPSRQEDRPDRDPLAARFEHSRRAA